MKLRFYRNIYYKLNAFNSEFQNTFYKSDYITCLVSCSQDLTDLPTSLCQLPKNVFQELVETGVNCSIDKKNKFLNFKTKSDLKLCVYLFPHFLRSLPSSYWTNDLLLIVAKTKPEILKEFPKGSIPESVWLSAIEYDSSLFTFIPERSMTEAIAIKVILSEPYFYSYLPEHIKKNRRFCLKTLHISSLPFHLMSKEFREDEEFKCLALKKPSDFFRALIKTSEISDINELKTIVSQRGVLLDSIPLEKKTWEICFLAVKQYPPAIKFVPNGEMKKKLYKYLAHTQHTLLYDRPDKSVDKIKYLQAYFEFEERTIDSKLTQSLDFWKWLLSKNSVFRLTHRQKFDEIKHLLNNQTTKDTTKVQSYRDELLPLFTKTQHTLRLVRKTNFIYDQKLKHELLRRGLKIESSIYDDLFKIKYHEKPTNDTALSYPELNVDLISVLKHSQLKGGRTLKKEGHHFKFYKIGENLSDFLREGVVVRYLTKHKKALELKSEIPEYVSVSRILVTKESRSWVANFKDKPEIIEDASTRHRYFLVYHYQASNDYCVFAHQKSDDPSNPYLKAHEGLKKGIFDVGRLAKNGMLFTSILPTFHNDNKERKWIVLAHCLSYIQEFPGCMINWCTHATEFPDYGYSGLRDFGDYALLGVCTDYYPSSNHRYLEKNREWITTQKGSLYNSLIENCLGVLLLYARLHRNDQNYHYKNPIIISETQEFIDVILHKLVQGYLGNKYESVCQLMGMTMSEYQEWLEIVSQRLIYWTEEQAEDKPCYAQDIAQTGKLDPSLYPECEYLATLPSNFNPVIGFSESKENPNLGAPHTPFPLMNFLEGVTLLLLEIEKHTMPEHLK